MLLAVLGGGAVLATYVSVSLWSQRLASPCAVAVGTGIISYVLLHSKDVLAALELETQAASQLANVPFASAIPWTPYALTPRVAARLLQEIQIRGARCVVECGAGVSTVLIGSTLRALGGGRLYALEHNAEWAGFVRRLVETNGLSEYVTIVEAPLADACFLGRRTRWYDAEAVRSGLREAPPFDVLVVDGPPQASGPVARLGALPFFAERLSRRSLLLLDDLHRVDEQEIVALWAKVYSLTPIAVDEEEGYGFYVVQGQIAGGA